MTVTGGFLAPKEWLAAFIGLRAAQRDAQPVRLRHQFTLGRPVSRATLYATALGAYQVYVNGVAVDDQVLKPGWTPFRLRLIHETTDVTALLLEGDNAVGIDLAGGWFTERYGFHADSPPFYGRQPSVAAQLVVEFQDGSSEIIVTDRRWLATDLTPIRSSSLYDGEHYDARLESPGWSTAGFAAQADWAPAVEVAGDWPVPVARASPPVRAIEEVAVHEVIRTPSGTRIFDFGQNLVGRLRLTVLGRPGDVITIRHAEVLEFGELATRPLRLAQATDSYTLRGDGVETWEPSFTFHGFRYVEISGIDLDASAVTAVVIHSDMRRTGWFTSSNALLNRFHENAVWGMRGNFLYLPTDCPQRDERLGWTGDIQVFAPTAAFLFDVDAFLSSWLEDLALEQKAAGDGIVPFVVPNVLHDGATAAAAWGDAATIVPTVLYRRYGDQSVIATQYPSMRDWCDHLLGLAGDRMLWEDGFQFGDWLDPAAPVDDASRGRTSPDIVASAYLFRSLTATADAATLLGFDDDARRFQRSKDLVRRAFAREYITPSGRMLSDSPTAYSLAIVFGLVDEPSAVQRMGDRLAELVRADGYRIGTGFVGTPIVADALTVTGHSAEAGRLLLQTENPSWLYPVTMGATTVWERWDSMLEDGTINPGAMTSFNHYALGAVADWLHRSVAGIDPVEPGYRVFRVAPLPLDGLDHALAEIDTPYGRASVGWWREGGTVRVEAHVPSNAEAMVELPGATDRFSVGSGVHRWTIAMPAWDPAPPVGLRTSLAKIMDDPPAYDAVWAAIESVEPGRARQLKPTVRWTEGRTLFDVFRELPASTVERVMRALESLNEERR